MFHGNFWPNLEMDLETGRFVEKQNLLSTPSALYRMTDPQFMVDHLKDDLALAALCLQVGVHPGPGPGTDRQTGGAFELSPGLESGIGPRTNRWASCSTGTRCAPRNSS